MHWQIPWRHFGKPTPYIIVMSVALDKRKSRTPDSLFPPDKYVNKPGVVVFAEHSTRLRDGTPVTYDREALEKIARNCNRRIEETGNYAAVCIGHTDEDSSDKPLIGFADRFPRLDHPHLFIQWAHKPAPPNDFLAKAHCQVTFQRLAHWIVPFTDRAPTARLRY